MKWIDLSLEIYHGLKTYQSHRPISISEDSTFANSGHRYCLPCHGFESRKLDMSDHTGTHVDAPNHFIPGGKSAAEIELDQMMGQAIMLDVSHKKYDQLVTADLLEEALQKQGQTIHENDIVLIHMFPKAWGSDGFFEAVSLSDDAADWLTDKKIKMVGIDLPNADEHTNMQRPVHMKLLEKEIYIIENLVQLQALPREQHFTFMGLPLKIKGATASPIRAIAKLD